MQLINAAREILEEIQPATIRAVCYRLFTMNMIESQLTWAREEGVIPWEWVVDETREAEGFPGWDTPEIGSPRCPRLNDLGAGKGKGRGKIGLDRRATHA